MEEIVISKPNHSYLILDASPGVEAEIRDYFSFYVPNYQHMPKYKYGVWDGKFYLYNFNSKLFPVGLLEDLCKFAKSRNYNIRFNDVDEKVYIAPKSDVYDLKIPITDSKGEIIEPRDYQINSVNSVIQNQRRIILSPTGSGKSLIIYMIMRYFQNFKTLVITPTTALVEQMYKDFQEYSQKDGSYSVSPETVHRIYSGHDKDPPESCNCVISTWQSIYKLPKNWFWKFNVVVGDEVHGFKAASLTKIMENSVNAHIRVGTTGTLDNSQINELILKGSFGPIHVATTTKKLMDSNTLAQMSIDVITLNHEETIPSKVPYQDEIKYLVKDYKRNRFISKLALSQKTNTLILFNYVEDHGKPLYELIKEMNPDDTRPIYYISGEIDVKIREEIRALMEMHENAILLASFGTFSTGINLKNLHNIIFAAPTKSVVRVLQSIGRGLRKYHDYKLKIYDIVDDYSGNRKKKNYAFKHGVDRLKIYAAQKFKYKIHGVKL